MKTKYDQHLLTQAINQIQAELMEAERLAVTAGTYAHRGEMGQAETFFDRLSQSIGKIAGLAESMKELSRFKQEQT